jgi:hypothetical protein
MSAALASLPVTVAYRPDLDARPATIDRGTAVRLCLAGGWSKAGMTEEGVVIEVVPPGERVRSARVEYRPRQRSSGSSVHLYVAQCWEHRVVRHARELVVVSL